MCIKDPGSFEHRKRRFDDDQVKWGGKFYDIGRDLFIANYNEMLNFSNFSSSNYLDIGKPCDK